MPNLDCIRITNLLPRAARGDSGARCTIIEALAAPVLLDAERYCRKFHPTLDSARDAGDIASIVLSKLLPPDGKRGLFLLRNPLAMNLFVNRVVRSESMNMVRLRKAEALKTTSLNRPLGEDGTSTLQDIIPDDNAHIPGTPEDLSTDSTQEIRDHALANLLRQCMKCLTGQEREAILIRFQLTGAPQAAVFGKQQLVTVKQVAELMGAPQYDVNNWIYRGLKKLAAKLGDLGCRPIATEKGISILQEVSHER